MTPTPNTAPMTTPTSHLPRTAAQAYRRNHGDVARLLDRLRTELDQHANAAKVDPRNWGRVGDLAKVCNDLIDILAFTQSTDRDAIEHRLAD